MDANVCARFWRGWGNDVDWASIMEIARLVQHEMLLLCVVFFALGALDDLGFDCAYIWLRLTGRMKGAAPVPARPPARHAHSQRLAIFVPAWQEAEVIGPTVRRMQAAWGSDDYTIYIGCYRNDPATIAASMHGVEYPKCVTIVIHGHYGPTTKGDCLNQLWAAMQADEARDGFRYSGLVLHDAEDWAHKDELTVHRHYLQNHAMVQIPVVPFIPKSGAWVAGHYADEFAEAHGKTLRVRNALGGSLPAAGVGCAFDRDMMHFIAQDRGGVPFSSDSLVEDYELGLIIHQLGGRPVLAYHRGADGALVATQALFPTQLDAAVRQKTRWLTGIALAGWDRLGWQGGPLEYWMRLHDRRSIIAAIILAMGYSLMALSAALWILEGAGPPPKADATLTLMAALCGAMLLWRLAVRAAFVGRRYGWRHGLWSLARQPLANVIAIMAARRAVLHYARYCLGRPLTWDKTAHKAQEHAPVRGDAADPRQGEA